jgi:hypothetical protein
MEVEPGQSSDATEPVPAPPADVTAPGVDEPQFATYPAAETTPPPPAPPRASTLKKALVIAVALVVTFAIAAGAFVFVALKGTSDVIDQMVPANSTVYFTAYLDPAAKQKLNLRGLIDRFPAIATSADLNRKISEALDQALEETGLKSTDVLPWIGTQIAVVVRYDGDKELAAVLVASKDDTAAMAALAKIRKGSLAGDSWTDQQHEGTTISVGTSETQPDLAYAFTDHVAIIAQNAAIVGDVIDTTVGKSPSLSESKDFKAAVGSLPKERLGLLYMNLKPLIERLKQEFISNATLDLTQLSSSFGQLEAFTGMGATLSAQPNGVAFDLTLALDPSKLSDDQRAAQAVPAHQNAVLAFTPADAYSVVAGTGFRETMKSALTEMAKDESFPQLDQELGLTKMVDHLTGDYGVVVSPGSDILVADAALMVGTDDEAGMQGFLDKATTKAGDTLQNDFGGPQATWERTSHNGVTITHLAPSSASDFGFDPAYAVRGGMAILGSSVDEVMAILDAKAGGANVTTSANFAAALPGGSANSGMLYVNIEGIVSAYRDTLSPEDQTKFDADGAPNLAPLKAFTFITTNSPDRLSIRFFLLVG